MAGTSVLLSASEAEAVFMVLARLRIYAATKDLPDELRTLLEQP